jgi:hypothetical protein
MRQFVEERGFAKLVFLNVELDDYGSVSGKLAATITMMSRWLAAEKRCRGNALPRLRIFCLCTPLMLMAQGANAQFSPPATPLSAVTVRDYVTACKAQTNLCVLEVAITVVTKVDATAPPQFCMQSKYDDDAVLNWLNSHPETFQLPREDGILLALKSIFPCS